jgi:predicted MFS family arabinose efflux permease
MRDWTDWLTWPADVLLGVAGVVASWVLGRNAPAFPILQMMLATLLLAAVVLVIVCWRPVAEYLRMRWKHPRARRPS